MQFCDNCAATVPNPTDRYAFPSVPVDVASANAGESATLCRRCACSVADRCREWFDIEQYRESNA